MAEVGEVIFVLTSMSEKAIAQVKSGATELIGEKVPKEQAKDLVEKLAGGHWIYDYGLTATEAKSLGLNVTAGIFASVLKFIQLYPHRPGCPDGRGVLTKRLNRCQGESR